MSDVAEDDSKRDKALEKSGNLHQNKISNYRNRHHEGITRNEREVVYPIIHMDSNCNAILFIDTPTMPGERCPLVNCDAMFHVHF